MIGMKSKTEQAKKMLERLFDGSYDTVQFSCDFPSFCFQNYYVLEEEHKGLGYYLDQEIPDICDEGEPGFDSTNMIERLKGVYEKIKAFCN